MCGLWLVMQRKGRATRGTVAEVDVVKEMWQIVELVLGLS